MYKQMDLDSCAFSFFPHCKACGSLAVVRDGRYRRTHDRVYRCKHCGARCILGRSDLYRMRNHSHAVSLAVELYSRGGLSFRTVAAILLKYLGVKVSHGAVAYWLRKTARSPWIPKLIPECSPVWHIDETYIRINKEWWWLIVVFCSTNKLVLSWRLARDNNCKELEAALRQAVENAGFRPREIVSDGNVHTPYAVKQAFGWRFVKHRIERGVGHNNPVERNFREVKRRVKWFSSFRSRKSAEDFFTVFFFAHNFLKAHSSLGWRTPACAAGIKQVSLKELLEAHPP
ncbi:MAG: DDE-type integrase/transposase/recombinase [Candidatus Micrarchaeia archaeon]